MKALGSSYLKVLTCRQRVKEREKIGVLSREETRFAAHQKRVGNGFSSSLAVSFEHKCNRGSISASSSAQINNRSEEIQTDRSKTVRVRFKLQKECTFGQQFLIVGDDPIVGLWDPSDGVPLNWSEGHVWIAEMDIPSGQMIKYKFILKGDSENIYWQPGPDRILETWPTDKTITVSEDWDNAELQNIVEEEIVDDVKNESLINSELLIVAENLNRPIMDKETDVVDLAEKPCAPVVAENITEESEKQDNLTSVTDDKNEESKVRDDDGVPVLVPGLISMVSEEIEEADLNKAEKYDSVERGFDDSMVSEEIEEADLNKAEKYDSVERGFDEVEDSTELEETHQCILQETHETTTTIDQKQQINSADHVLESDLQWGRRTLQKILANFGFQ